MSANSCQTFNEEPCAEHDKHNCYKTTLFEWAELIIAIISFSCLVGRVCFAVLYMHSSFLAPFIRAHTVESFEMVFSFYCLNTLF